MSLFWEHVLPSVNAGLIDQHDVACVIIVSYDCFILSERDKWGVGTGVRVTRGRLRNGDKDGTTR